MTQRAPEGVARWVATWFGCGYTPAAPGTAGSMAALGIAILLNEFAGWGAMHFLVLAGVLFPLGVWASGVMESRMGKEDPGIVVIDEVVGQWVTLAGVTAFQWQSWVAAFLLFRIFDILKPPPVRQMERLGGGVGIMADDVMAGAYGALLLLVAGRWNLY